MVTKQYFYIYVLIEIMAYNMLHLTINALNFLVLMFDSPDHSVCYPCAFVIWKKSRIL